MARVKITPECRLKSWAEVDTAFQQIAQCERVLEDLTNDMNDELDAVKRKYADMSAPVLERKDQFSADVCQFVTEHRGEMEGKTMELNFGRTGFRISTKLKYNKGVKVADAVAALLQLKLGECVKTTQTVVSDVLKRQPADVLAKVGVYLDRADAFWFETKREEIQPTQEVQ